MTADDPARPMNFASDNTSGAVPEVMAALQREAAHDGPAYGSDPSTEALHEVLADLFEHELAVFPVATGTAANALSLASLNPPWGGVVCHRESHIAVDELVAPTVFGGGLSLVPLEGEHAKLVPVGHRRRVRSP